MSVVLLPFLLVLACFKLCQKVQAEPKVRNFSTQLYSAVSRGNLNKNVVLSPLCLRATLAPFYIAAKGQTKVELKRCLHKHYTKKNFFLKKMQILLSKLEEKKMHLATHLIADEKIKFRKRFESLIRRYLNTDITFFDFSSKDAEKKINLRIANGTHQKVKHLLNHYNLEKTSLLVVGTFSFHCNWSVGFNKSKTTEANFWNKGVKVTKVDMMHRTDYLPYAYITQLDAQVIELNFAGSNISMLIILPRELNGLNRTISNLKYFQPQRISKLLHRQHVDIRLPKFKLEFFTTLKRVLYDLGIRQLFIEADLSAATSSTQDPLFVSDVVHATILEVNETGGTRSIAAAAIEWLPKLVEPVQFTVNRPFVFVIRDLRTTYIIGHITKL